MHKIFKSVKGFGAVELVVALVIVTLIGTAGYLVYKNKHQQVKVITATKTSTPVSKTGYLVVNEWGIKIPIPSTGDTYSYTISDSDNIFLTSQMLTKAVADAATAVREDCGLSGIEVSRNSPGIQFTYYSYKISPAINGYVYVLPQDPATNIPGPCNRNNELNNTIDLLQVQFASVWDNIISK